MKTSTKFDNISLSSSQNDNVSEKSCRENRITYFVNLMFIGPCIIVIVEE